MTPAIATFTFQSDITAAELAGCMNTLRMIFMDVILDKDVFNTLPAGVKRHFTVTELYNEPPSDPPTDPSDQL